MCQQWSYILLALTHWYGNFSRKKNTHNRHHRTHQRGWFMGVFCELKVWFIYHMFLLLLFMQCCLDLNAVCRQETLYGSGHGTVAVSLHRLIAKPGNETATVSWPDPYWNHWWHVSSEENEINTLGQNVGNIFKCIFLGKIYLDKNFSEVCSHRSTWWEVSFIRTWVFD